MHCKTRYIILLPCDFWDVYRVEKGWDICSQTPVVCGQILLLPRLGCVFSSCKSPSVSCWEARLRCLWEYDWFSVGGGWCAVQQLLLWLSTVGTTVERVWTTAIRPQRHRLSLLLAGHPSWTRDKVASIPQTFHINCWLVHFFFISHIQIAQLDNNPLTPIYKNE